MKNQTKSKFYLILILAFTIISCNKKVQTSDFIMNFNKKNGTEILKKFSIFDINRSGYKFVYINLPNGSTICLKNTINANLNKIVFDEKNILNSIEYRQKNILHLENIIKPLLNLMKELKIISVISNKEKIILITEIEDSTLEELMNKDHDFYDNSYQLSIKKNQILNKSFLFFYDETGAERKKDIIDSISNLKTIKKIDDNWYYYWTPEASKW